MWVWTDQRDSHEGFYWLWGIQVTLLTSISFAISQNNVFFITVLIFIDPPLASRQSVLPLCPPTSHSPSCPRVICASLPCLSPALSFPYLKMCCVDEWMNEQNGQVTAMWGSRVRQAGGTMPHGRILK